MMSNDIIEILLIEDDPNDAELTLHALKKNNVANNILHLRDGAEALEFLFGTGAYEGRLVTNGPRVILLDLKMPRVDGTEVLRRIKADERTRNIPVVVLTSSREDPDIATCYELGTNSYIVKPVDFEQFVETVRTLGMYWVLVNQPPQT